MSDLIRTALERLVEALEDEEGLEMYSDRKQAQSAAQSIMGSYEVAAHSDGWHEDMESVSWGMLVPVEQAQVVECKAAEPDDEFDEWVKHELRPARYAHQPAPPAEGEVGELVNRLRRASDGASAMGWEQDAWTIARAAELLQQRHPEPVPEPPADALAARPLLEKVARLGDVIGQQTVAQVQQLAEQAAVWLRDNPPGQPVAIEPRGCPMPGACACVEPALPLPTGKEPTRLRNCPTHGQQPPWAWGCPECVRQLREELAALQQRHPEPVPVSERLPGPEDCNEMGQCWWFDAELWCLDIYDHEYTHWRPAHSLPLPATTRDIKSND